MSLQTQTQANMREIRRITGRTVQRMAAELRISEAGLRRKLNGGTGGGASILLPDVQRVADWAGVDPYDLLRWHLLDAYRREYLATQIRLHLGLPGVSPENEPVQDHHQTVLPTH